MVCMVEDSGSGPGSRTGSGSEPQPWVLVPSTFSDGEERRYFMGYDLGPLTIGRKVFRTAY